MSKKQTQNEFIEKSKKIFGSQFDYSEVNYVNSRTKVILKCKEHGKFLIAPKDHISYKRGCVYCSGAKYNTFIFIEKANQIHGEIFDYSKVNFKEAKTKIIIICKTHGAFLQLPHKHIAGQGCPKCKKTAKKNLEYVIKMGTIIHDGKYDYSKSIFTRMFDNIIIICPKHGEFKQTPTNHINHGTSCPACMVGKSKKEEQWLNLIGIPNDIFSRAVILHVDGRRFIVDGYQASNNTIYEFYGDYWHGNPRIYNAEDLNEGNKIKFGILYNKTLEREKLLISYGYKIVSIWEDDFDKLFLI